MNEIPQYRCGYCSTGTDDYEAGYAPGRCAVCGSALYDCRRAVEGARHEEYIRRALKQLDRQFRLTREMRIELSHRRHEDLCEKRDPRRFDELPAPEGFEA